MDFLRGLRQLLGLDADSQALVQDQAGAASTEGLWKAAFLGDTATLSRLCDGGDGSAWLTRGAVGETLFHIAFLRADLSMARYLAHACPALVSTVYAGPPFYGENALHMAVAKRMPPEAVRWLVSCAPQLVHGHATGSYFAPEASFGFGETPLSFAVSVNEPALVRILVEVSAAGG